MDHRHQGLRHLPRPGVLDDIPPVDDTAGALPQNLQRPLENQRLRHPPTAACQNGPPSRRFHQAMKLPGVQVPVQACNNSLLTGALEARGRVLLKLNVDAADLDRVIALLPALKSPTVSKLFGTDASEPGFAVETVVSKSEINTLIPDLIDHGANGIIELPISKIVP